MKKRLLMTLMGVLLFSNVLFAMSKEERIEDAQSIINLFTQQYGPLKWKEENLGINFDQIATDLLNDAGNVSSDKDFYNAVAIFLSSFKDAHVSYKIPSSLSASLPFDTEYFKDGIIITRINREKLMEETFLSFKVGDKLIAIDGIPVEQVIDSLTPFAQSGHDATNRKFIGSTYLTYRPQSKFPEIPSGLAMVTIISKNGIKKDLQIKWEREGFDLSEMPPKSAINYMAKAMTIAPANLIEMSILDTLDRSFKININDKNNITSGIGSILPFFTMWENFQVRQKAPYYTGTFQTGGHTIGLIRIPSWEFVPQIDELENEIEYMNNNTDALVIDQTNNGGGSVCLARTIGSFFIIEPKNEIKFQVRANRSWLKSFENDYLNEWGEEKIHAESWLSALRKAVTNGEHLSAPLPICTVTGKIFPHKNKDQASVLYIKPVLILINELDFSTADMFPALMQDWGAAKLFGSRTAGAGGNVVGTQYIGNSELTIRLTQSLAYREKEVTTENGKLTHYIENVGATPDISYEITSKDYQNNYQSYREAINQAVIQLIKEPLKNH